MLCIVLPAHLMLQSKSSFLLEFSPADRILFGGYFPRLLRIIPNNVSVIKTVHATLLLFISNKKNPKHNTLLYIFHVGMFCHFHVPFFYILPKWITKKMFSQTQNIVSDANRRMFFTVNNRNKNIIYKVDTFNSVLIKFPSRFSAWYNCDVIGVSYLNKNHTNSKTTRAEQSRYLFLATFRGAFYYYYFFLFTKKGWWYKWGRIEFKLN